MAWICWIGANCFLIEAGRGFYGAWFWMQVGRLAGREVAATEVFFPTGFCFLSDAVCSATMVGKQGNGVGIKRKWQCILSLFFQPLDEHRKSPVGGALCVRLTSIQPCISFCPRAYFSASTPRGVYSFAFASIHPHSIFHQATFTFGFLSLLKILFCC